MRLALLKRGSLVSLAVSGAVVASIFVASSAFADAVSDAKDLFTRGRELRTRGDCASAVAMFRKAYELYPEALGSLRNLAECDEALGRYASARRAWVDLKRALLTNADHKYDGWAQDADQAAARLAPMLATLTIDVNVVSSAGAAAPAEGVDVTLDGEKLASAQIGTPLERDPGRHVVRVSGERVAEAQERSVDLASGDAKRVALRVVIGDGKETGRERAVGTLTPAKVPDSSEDRALAARRTWGWIAVGIGGAALVGSGISIAVRQSALDDLNSQCPKYQDCSPTLQSTVDRGHLASALATALAVVGGVGVAGGIVLFATSGHKTAPQSTLVVSPALGGVSATWRF